MVPAETFVDVAPPVEITFVAPSLIVLTPATKLYPPLFLVQLVNHASVRSVGRVVVSKANDKPGSVTAETDFSLAPHEAVQLKVPTTRVLMADLNKPAVGSPQNALTLSVSKNGAKQSEQFVQQTVPVTYADVRVAPNLRVGWIRGFDYSLPNALAALGVESKELTR